MHRVVVTGIGPITCLGFGRSSYWEALLEGRNGIDRVRSFDAGAYPVQTGAEIFSFLPRDYCRRTDPQAIGRASQMAIAAAALAFDDAALKETDLDLSSVGVSMGTTSGEPGMIEQFNDAWIAGTLDDLAPRHMLLYSSNSLAIHIAREFQLDGPLMTIPCACAAGNYAISHAADSLRLGQARVMLAGGADAFSRITYAGFARLGAISPDMVRPFDRKRSGMVPGEGACILVLETLEDAVSRGARIYAEVLGCGFSCDAHHMTAAHPEGCGAARALRRALAESNLAPSDVDYISAHGTGTPTNDRLETLATKRALSGDAYRVAISSIKSMLGHSMGAASALEAACCCLAIAKNCVPPTINLENPDPECDLDYVPNVAREMEVKVAVNNAYAFGGNNSSVVFGRVM